MGGVKLGFRFLRGEGREVGAPDGSDLRSDSGNGMRDEAGFSTSSRNVHAVDLRD